MTRPSAARWPGLEAQYSILPPTPGFPPLYARLWRGEALSRPFGRTP